MNDGESRAEIPDPFQAITPGRAVPLAKAGR